MRDDDRRGPSGRPRKSATAQDARQARNEVRRAKRREQGVRPRVLLSPVQRMHRKVEEKRRWRESDPAIRRREAAAKSNCESRNATVRDGALSSVEQVFAFTCYRSVTGCRTFVFMHCFIYKIYAETQTPNEMDARREVCAENVTSTKMYGAC